MASNQRRTAVTNGAHERMSVVDTAWLRMDKPGSTMTIVSVLTTATPVRAAQLRRLIAARLTPFSRFRRRPVADALGGSWQDDATFSLDAHWVETVLPAPAGPDELQALAGRLASEPLAPTRPLWQIHFVPRYGAGSAWVLRVHHCYGDGAALLRVLLALTEPEPGSASPRAQAGRRHAADGTREADAAAQGRHGWPVVSWLDRLALPAGAMLESAIADATRWLGHGEQPAAQVGDIARVATQARQILGEFAHVLTLPDDPVTPLRGEVSGEKRVAWGTPLDLAQVRAASRVLGCTINDVLLATVAGALGAYLRETHSFDTTDDLVLRASVPVNLRTGDDTRALGNQFGLLFVDLPVGIVDPLQRVRRTHQTMHALKASLQPAMTLAALGVMGMLPATLQQPALELFSRKGTLVASNVPGPQAPLYLCGQRIDELHFWVPQGGTIGLGVSVLSYAGKVFFGLIADRALISDPGALVHHIERELEQTLAATATVGVPGASVARPTTKRGRARSATPPTGSSSPSTGRRQTRTPGRMADAPD